MEDMDNRRATISPASPGIEGPIPETSQKRNNSSLSDGTHKITDRIIRKYMDRRYQNAPPETHHLVRKQSVFNFVERKEKPKPKQSTFKKISKKVRKTNTVIAFVVLVIYVSGGAALFWKIESKPNEGITEYENGLLKTAEEIYKQSKPSKCAPLKKRDNIKNNECLKIIYENLYTKPKHIDDYWAGLAYVLTCITTIGYGHLVCYTVAGKMVTVVYSIIGIALTIYVLRHNGKISLKVCNWVLGLAAKCVHLCGKSKVQFKMTVSKSFILLFVFWILGALGIASYENFLFWDAIYFSFSSFSTIGFGDLVPQNHTSGAIICLLHFINLSLLSMVFELVHQTMENNYMKVLELLDEEYRRQTTELNTGTMNLQSPGPSKRNMVTTARENNQQ